MSRLHLVAFEARRSLSLAPRFHVLPWPKRLFDVITTQYRSRPGIKADYSAPTRGIAELLCRFDPHIVHVSSNQNSPYWIIATAAPDDELLRTCLAVWAESVITPHRPDFDWDHILDGFPLTFDEAEVPLLEFGSRANGTAAPTPTTYGVLPTFLAHKLIDKGMRLRDHDREFMLGPPEPGGRRTAVIWPPQLLGGKINKGLWTPKVGFHIETVPGHAHPRIHAEISTSRFPLNPVTYVPSRGDDGASVSIWLRADNGFVHPGEPDVLLSATAIKPRRNGYTSWVWEDHVAQVLARLTQLPFPDPEQILADPAAAVKQNVAAFVLHNEGSRSEASDLDDDPEDSEADSRKTKSAKHPAKSGFQPVDHEEVRGELVDLLDEYDIAPIDPLPPRKSSGPRVLKPADTPRQDYVVKLHAQSPDTQQAMLDAAVLEKGLTRSASSSPDTIVLTGAYTLTLKLPGPSSLAAGIPRPAKGDKDTTADRRKQRTSQIADILTTDPATPETAIVEIAKPSSFKAARLLDPYQSIKQGGAIGGQVPQCLHPITPHKPTALSPHPYPGSIYSKGDIHRAATALDDALRQHGRLGRLPAPPGVDEFELIGLWVAQTRYAKIPLALRMDHTGQALIVLATRPDPIPYIEAPRALALGEGRIRKTKHINTDDQIAEFLINVMGIDPDNPDIHDRVVFVRAATFRNARWDWLQDQHLTPDSLILPGVSLREADTSIVKTFTPGDLPGLRVIRVRERDSRGEVPRGYTLKDDGTPGRVSGLFPYTDNVFYAVNPRSDQQQTPLGITKFDPEQPHNAAKRGSNPNPLEVTTAFMQPSDDHGEWADYTHKLRRCYQHTDIPTIQPAPTHLCTPLEEYIW